VALHIQAEEPEMFSRTAATICASVFTCIAISLPSGDAAGQAAKDVVGSWMMASNINTRPDGIKMETFGPNAKGSLILTSDGRFSVVNVGANVPKFASNSRIEGTPEEYKAVVQSSIGLFGTYSLDEAGKVLTLNIEASTYPNWTGTSQKRPLAFSGDEMKWTVAASAGGQSEVVWKRIQPATTGSAK